MSASMTIIQKFGTHFKEADLNIRNSANTAKKHCTINRHNIQQYISTRTKQKMNIENAVYFRATCDDDAVAPNLLSGEFMRDSAARLEARFQRVDIPHLRALGITDIAFITQYDKKYERRFWQLDRRFIIECPKWARPLPRLRAGFGKEEISKWPIQSVITDCIGGIASSCVDIRRKRECSKSRTEVASSTLSPINERELAVFYNLLEDTEPLDWIFQFGID